MKLSEMTMEHLSQWCHVEPGYPLLEDAWRAAVQAVLSHTGLDGDEADRYEDVTMAAILLCSDMIYNRSVHADSDKMNVVFERLISLHDRNLLPGGEPDT